MPVPEAQKLRMLGRLELVSCKDTNELLFSTLQPSKLGKGRAQKWTFSEILRQTF